MARAVSGGGIVNGGGVTGPGRGFGPGPGSGSGSGMRGRGDVGLLSPATVGTRVEAETGDAAVLQAMLDAEAALARAQAQLGVVPPEHAATISALARIDNFDVRRIAERSAETANPVVALVADLASVVGAVDEEAAHYVHRGSTSQDVLDTGLMLVAARALRILDEDLLRTADALAALAVEHRDVPAAARTLTQHAVPTTFGLKAAGWLAGVLDARRRVAAAAGELPVSVGGAAGTLAGYLEFAARTLGESGDSGDRGGERDGAAAGGDAWHGFGGEASTFGVGRGAAGGAEGGEVRGDWSGRGAEDAALGCLAAECRAGGEDYAAALTAGVAAELGLAAPVVPWHTLRAPIASLGAVLGLVVGALGKFAVDVQVLARTEIAEVREPCRAGRGASSAMPHKRNPVLSTRIRAASLQAPQLTATLLACMPAEDERPAGAWHAEWSALRELLRLAGGAAEAAAELAGGLTVDVERARANLRMHGELLVSERVSVALAPALGRMEARRVVTSLALRAVDSGVPLRELLTAEPAVTAVLTPDRIRELLDPAHYTGAAGALVDRAVEAYWKERPDRD